MAHIFHLQLPRNGMNLINVWHDSKTCHVLEEYTQRNILHKQNALLVCCILIHTMPTTMDIRI